MAKLMFSGLDEIAKELSRMGENADAIAEQMLRAGANEVTDAWKKAIEEAGLIETGEMIDSVGPSGKGVQAKESTRYIEIYPQGRDSRGVRNAEKAFVNHYGNSTHTATGFVDLAEEYGEQMAVPVMQAIFDSFIETGTIPQIELKKAAPGRGGRSGTKKQKNYFVNPAEYAAYTSHYIKGGRGRSHMKTGLEPKKKK